MFTVKSPVKGYSGSGYGLDFRNGEATTDNHDLAMRLKGKGYIVTDIGADKPKAKTDEVKAKQ